MLYGIEQGKRGKKYWNKQFQNSDSNTREEINKSNKNDNQKVATKTTSTTNKTPSSHIEWEKERISNTTLSTNKTSLISLTAEYNQLNTNNNNRK